MKRSLLHVAAALLIALPAAAEVSVNHLPGGAVELYFQASDAGPWKRVRPDIPSGDLLNAQGDAKSDSWPVRETNPATGDPEVAWATAGDEGEIQLAWHDGTAWNAPLNLSNRSGADFGPSLGIDQWGNRFVAWNNSRGSRHAVVLAGVDDTGTMQTAPRELSARQRDSRQPSLVVFDDGDLYIAYEEQANGSDDVPYIAIDRAIPNRNGAGHLHCSGENSIDLSRSVTIRTGLNDRQLCSDAKVNVESGKLWVTWVDSRFRVGWVELMSPGVFTNPQYRPYDPSAGDAGARDDIREQVLAP